MRGAAALMVAVALASSGVRAQTPREVATTMPPPNIAPAVTAAPAPSAGNWIVSETRSPVDYSLVATATLSSSGLQLVIQCRGGRTEMAVSSAMTALKADRHTVFYVVNDAPAVPVALGPASDGGLALKGDVARFLASLPEQGDVVFRVVDREGQSIEGRYALAGLKKMAGRLAGPCKWPVAAIY